MGGGYYAHDPDGASVNAARYPPRGLDRPKNYVNHFMMRTHNKSQSPKVDELCKSDDDEVPRKGDYLATAPCAHLSSNAARLICFEVNDSRLCLCVAVVLMYWETAEDGRSFVQQVPRVSWNATRID